MSIISQIIDRQQDIKQISIAERGQETFLPCQHICLITYTDQRSEALLLDGNDITSLIQHMEKDKIVCCNRDHFHYTVVIPVEHSSIMASIVSCATNSIGSVIHGGMKATLWLRHYSGL